MPEPTLVCKDLDGNSHEVPISKLRSPVGLRHCYKRRQIAHAKAFWQAQSAGRRPGVQRDARVVSARQLPAITVVGSHDWREIVAQAVAKR